MEKDPTAPLPPAAGNNDYVSGHCMERYELENFWHPKSGGSFSPKSTSESDRSAPPPLFSKRSYAHVIT